MCLCVYFRGSRSRERNRNKIYLVVIHQLVLLWVASNSWKAWNDVIVYLLEYSVKVISLDWFFPFWFIFTLVDSLELHCTTPNKTHKVRGKKAEEMKNNFHGIKESEYIPICCIQKSCDYIWFTSTIAGSLHLRNSKCHVNQSALSSWASYTQSIRKERDSIQI